MKPINYCLTLVDHCDQVVGMYGIFENRQDLYIYLGSIINNCPRAITINYLEHYDVDFDTFDEWVNRVISKNCVLCIFTESSETYKILVSHN